MAVLQADLMYVPTWHSCLLCAPQPSDPTSTPVFFFFQNSFSLCGRCGASLPDTIIRFSWHEVEQILGNKTRAVFFLPTTIPCRHNKTPIPLRKTRTSVLSRYDARTTFRKFGHSVPCEIFRPPKRIRTPWATRKMACLPTLLTPRASCCACSGRPGPSTRGDCA